MSKLKVLARNVKPTNTQLLNYNVQYGRVHNRAANLRFGKVVIMTDTDLDG